MFLVCGETLWDLFAPGLARLNLLSAPLTGISGDPTGQRLAAAPLCIRPRADQPRPDELPPLPVAASSIAGY